MRLSRRPFAFFLVISVVCLMCPLVTRAYLDPGTGSSVLQLLLAGLFVTSFVIRLGWSKIKGWVSKTKPPVEPKAGK